MPDGGSDNSRHEWADGSGSRAGERLPVLEQAVAALRAGDAAKAGQLLISAHGTGRLPERFNLLHELARQVGPKPLSELLLRLAAFQCFYCRGGLQICEACAGRGRTGDGWPCERCVGLGAARCDFCDGSGWASLETMPPALRPLVILQRVRLALRSSRKLLSGPAAAAQPAGEGDARKQAARQLAAVERQRAILDDALATAERAGINSRLGQELQKLVPECAACVPEVEARLRDCLGGLAEAARVAAEAASSDSSLQRRAKSQVSYYDALRRSEGFAGSGLERPHLRQTLRSLQPAPDLSEAEGNPEAN